MIAHDGACAAPDGPCTCDILAIARFAELQWMRQALPNIVRGYLETLPVDPYTNRPTEWAAAASRGAEQVAERLNRRIEQRAMEVTIAPADEVVA